MSGTRILGILLMIVGVAVLVVEGIEYTSTETVVDLGPIEVEAEQERNIPIEPIAAGLAIVGGFALIGVRRKD